MILRNMDATSNPCEDFYQYACGGFGKTAGVPAPDGRIHTWDIPKRKLEEQLHTLFKDQKVFQYSNATIHLFRLVKACENEEAIQKAGKEPLESLLSQLANWSGAGQNQQSWEMLMAHIKTSINGNPILSIGVDTWNQPGELEIHPGNFIETIYPRISLPIAAQLFESAGHKLLEHYEKFCRAASDLLRDNSPDAHENDYVQVNNCGNISEFIGYLLKFQISPGTLKHMTVGELTDMYKNIGWLNILKTVFSSNSKNISNSTHVRVHRVETFGMLDKFAANDEGKRVITNTLMWFAAQESTKYLSKPFTDIRDEFIQRIEKVIAQFAGASSSDGKTGNLDRRSDECIKYAWDSLPLAALLMYSKAFISQNVMKQTRAMAEKIQLEYKNTVSRSRWLDENTKVEVLKTIDEIVRIIVLPEEINDLKVLDSIYLIKLGHANGHFEYWRKTQEFRAMDNLKRLHNTHKSTPTEDVAQEHGLYDVSAYARTNPRYIDLNAAMTQFPFFMPSAINAANLAGFGMVVGHEITHYFEHENGYIFHTTNTRKAFREKRECFMKQYSNYTVVINGNKYYVNGSFTVRDNICDNFGIRIAYKVYKKWLDENGSEGGLPGLDKFRREQIFFLSFANIWCSVEGDAFTKKHLKEDEHSPHKFRVIGSLSNLPEFSEAFQCSPGSAMNRKNKCSLW